MYVTNIYKYIQIYANIQIHVTIFVFYPKQNVRAFITILGVTMKVVAFES